MKINILRNEYIYSEKFIEDFKTNNVGSLQSEYTDESVEINNIEPFNFYLNISNEDRRSFEYIDSLNKIINYLILPQKILMNHDFWITLFSKYYYSFTISKFPQLLTKNSDFKNILFKSFDWENYIYKLIIITQYIEDTRPIEEYQKYFNIVVDNLDVVNYLLKNKIFNNANFFVNVLDTIVSTDSSKVLKKSLVKNAKKDKDERVGRKVIFEFNRDYPVISSPILDFEEFKLRFIKYYNEYARKSKISVQ